MTSDVSAGAWPFVKVREVTDNVKSWNPSAEAEFTYVDISSIDNDRCEIVDAKRVLGSQAPSRARRPIRDGDIVFSNVRTYLRNVAQVCGLQQPAVASTGFTVLRPTSAIDSRFLYHVARSDYFIGKVTPEQTGTHYPATSDRVVRDQSIPLPDLPTQRALAGLIDELEGKRTSSASHLALARRSIERFQQAVLAAACSGRLTAGWRLRSLHVDDSDDPAGDISKLPPIPTTWCYRRMDSLNDPEAIISYGIVLPGPQVRDGVPYVRQQDVVGGTVLLDGLGRTTPEIAQKHSRSALLEGDVLLCIIRNLRVAIVPAGLDGANITQGMVRIRPGEHVIGRYLAAYLESPYAQRWMKDQYVGLAMPRINVADARAMPIPVPPIDEQREIVSRLDDLLGVAQTVEDQIDASDARLDRCSQSVLAKAFRGELTPPTSVAQC